jgi:hypothetical protein
MSRLDYTCPKTCVIILTDAFVETRYLPYMSELHFAVYCHACSDQHWASITQCRAYTARKGAALRAEAS